MFAAESQENIQLVFVLVTMTIRSEIKESFPASSSETFRTGTTVNVLQVFEAWLKEGSCCHVSSRVGLPGLPPVL